MHGTPAPLGTREHQTNPWPGISRRLEIAAEAYKLWNAAGHPTGRDLEFWLQAEAELEAARRSGNRRVRAPGTDHKNEAQRFRQWRGS